MKITIMKIRTALTVVLVGVAFYFGAKLGLVLSTPPDYIATFWPPNTVILAALLLTDRRRWWIYFLAMTPAYFTAALQAEYSVQRAIIFYTANCTEILVAALALKYILGNRLKFDQLRSMVVFILVAVLIAPVVSAFMASTTTFAEPEVNYWLAWRVWFLGDALGHLTLTPVIILWIYPNLGLVKEVSFARLIEVSGLALCLFVVSYFSLGTEIGSLGNVPALLYTPLPVLLWAAIRFGPRGICSVVFIIALLAIWNAVNGRGPFTTNTPADNVLSLQLFLIAISIPVMLLSSILSERKQGEDKLRKFSHAIDNSSAVIVITDTNGIIEYVNSKFTQTTGYTSEEAMGKNPRVLKSGKTAPEVYKNLWETITSGNEWSGEFCNKKKNGELYFESALISSVKNTAGVITHFIAVKEDITKRKQVEEQLNKSKEDAETANLVKSQFLANMSHEIRTPMNGIIGMTGLLMDTTLSGEQREYADTICNSADSLLTLINDILDFSKIEAGKLEMENIDFDLRGVVEGSADIFTVKANEKKLDFSCFVDTEIPYMLRGDPGRLKQVLVNFISNAIKFTKEGEVSIRVTTAGETDSHATVHFAVRDTGTGIPADKIDCLFQSFSQVDASTTRKYGGTGLGLAICKQIVALTGGEIGVESEEGKGSTFWFTTIMEKQPLRQEQTSFEHGNIENLRVLVTDGNKTSRQIFRTYLESINCRVEEATSAEEIINKLHTSVAEGDPFKIALIDYYTLKSEVESLGQKIKADPQLRDLHLIVLTSFGERGDARHFRNLGFDAYLVKPIKQTQLHDCLRIVTGKQAGFGEDISNQIVTRYSISEDNKLRIRVLLAEDNIVNKKIALHILEKKFGYHADAVTNGKEAIEHLKRFDYDLVLMDCQMPEMDGYEATRAIRDNSSSVKNPGIPIIAMTANAMKGDREKCLEAGMDDYITKPINVKKLANAIERNIVKKE